MGIGCLRAAHGMGRMTARTRPNYLVIGMWLAGLMLVGVLLSELSGGWLPLSRQAVAALVLLLSTIKAVLVALYFMHLQADRKLLAFIAAAPIILLLLVLALYYSHYLIRL